MVFQECLYGMSILRDLLRGDICLYNNFCNAITMAKEIEQTIQTQKVEPLQKNYAAQTETSSLFLQG